MKRQISTYIFYCLINYAVSCMCALFVGSKIVYRNSLYPCWSWRLFHNYIWHIEQFMDDRAISDIFTRSSNTCFVHQFASPALFYSFTYLICQYSVWVIFYLIRFWLFKNNYTTFANECCPCMIDISCANLKNINICIHTLINIVLRITRTAWNSNPQFFSLINSLPDSPRKPPIHPPPHHPSPVKTYTCCSVCRLLSSLRNMIYVYIYNTIKYLYRYARLLVWKCLIPTAQHVIGRSWVRVQPG